jgi:hypothetical protein
MYTLPLPGLVAYIALAIVILICATIAAIGTILLIRRIARWYHCVLIPAFRLRLPYGRCPNRAEIILRSDIVSFDASLESQILITGHSQGEVGIWNLSSGSLRSVFLCPKVEIYSTVRKVAMSPQCTKIGRSMFGI